MLDSLSLEKEWRAGMRGLGGTGSFLKHKWFCRLRWKEQGICFLSSLARGPPALPALSTSVASGRLSNVPGTRTLKRRKGSWEWGIPIQLQALKFLVDHEIHKGCRLRKDTFKAFHSLLSITPAGCMIILELIPLGTSKLLSELFPHFSGDLV